MKKKPGAKAPEPHAERTADQVIRDANREQLPEAALSGEPTPDQSVKTDKEGHLVATNAKVETVSVKAAKPNQVGVWEVNPDHEAVGHEGGEIFVTGEEAQEVARTSLVEEKLRIGQLVEA